MSNNSPYSGKPASEWPNITKNLVDKHPLKDELVDIVLKSWDDIFSSSLGAFKIGIDIFTSPQIMGFFLHELIALNLQLKYPGVYRIGEPKTEKDIHNIQCADFSFEIKTSSDNKCIYANRSYAQAQADNAPKKKDGYYLAVNFEKFKNDGTMPGIKLIRFGYLDHSDWQAQASPKGQQAHLPAIIYKTKFLTLYPKG